MSFALKSAYSRVFSLDNHALRNAKPAETQQKPSRKRGIHRERTPSMGTA